MYQSIIARAAADHSTCHINIHSRRAAAAAVSSLLKPHTLAISITSRKMSTHRPVLTSDISVTSPMQYTFNGDTVWGHRW